MPDLLGYLNLLDKDAAALAAHKNDPVTAMIGYGLHPDEQAAMLTANRAEVATLVGISGQSFNAIDSIEWEPTTK